MQKIYGIGLSRTGTTSLTTFLSNLGYKIIHFPLTKTQIFSSNNNGCTDIPVIKYYKDLEKVFPDAKFIHTIRSKDSWLDSIERYLNKKIQRGDKLSKWHIEHRTYVYGQITFNYNVFSDAYDKHMNDVQTFFKNKPNKLLTVDIVGGESTKSVCTFLNVVSSQESYPHDNVRI